MFVTIIISTLILSTTTDVVSGKYILVDKIGRWIAQEKTVATWDDAQQRCERDGAILATPLDLDLFNYMKSLIEVNDHTTVYFIGMRTKHTSEGREGLFVSQEGKPLNQLPEAVLNMIEKLDLRDGDCLSMDRNSVRAVPCWEQLPFICYSNLTSPDCGPGYTYIPRGSCYKGHSESLSWNDAFVTCMQEGGHLAVVNDEEEARTIIDTTFEQGDRKPKWVGLRNTRRDSTDDWRSVQGESLDDIFNVWIVPPTDEEYKCSVLKSVGKLDDFNCAAALPFVCEKKIKI